jgi:hypothetical protein
MGLASATAETLHVNSFGTYCPIGYKLTEEHAVTHEFDPSGIHHNLEHVHGVCDACPDGYTSPGGIATTCHFHSTSWRICSHLACVITVDEHCKFHHSPRPAAEDDLGAAAVNKTACTGRREGKQRITVLHHVREQEGIMHKCFGDGYGNCKCKCRDV